MRLSRLLFHLDSSSGSLDQAGSSIPWGSFLARITLQGPIQGLKSSELNDVHSHGKRTNITILKPPPRPSYFTKASSSGFIICERQHLESLIESTRLWKRAQPKTSCKLHPSGSAKEKPPACLEALEAPTPQNLEYRPWKLMASNKYKPRLDR
jgi:hypothetical protein